MINPEGKPYWRPKTDLSGRFKLQPDYVLLEAYQPRDAADAIAYIRELALPELVAYDGHPCQQDMMRETAEKEWSHLFQDETEENPETALPAEIVQNATF